MSSVATIEHRQPKSVLFAMSDRFGMEPAAFEQTLRSTVVPANTSKEQFAAFLLVAREYNLNPITREIYAFPGKGGGIQPIVGIDGWMRIINDHPQFDGMEFEDVIEGGQLTAITCRIYRKDRQHPIAVTEYLTECKRDTEPWKKWPARMLRHKAAIQCARYAFGFSGIIDPDEYERGAGGGMRDVTPVPPPAPAAPPHVPLAGNGAGPAVTQPKRQPGQPRTDATPYKDASGAPLAHDQTTGEIIGDDIPEHGGFDLDGWLSSLEGSLAGCSDAETLIEVWNESAAPFIDDGDVPKLYQDKAEALYEQHVKRIEGAESENVKKARGKTQKKAKDAPAPAAPPEKSDAPLSNDESDAYLNRILSAIAKAATQEALDEIAEDFNDNWKPRLLIPDRGKVQQAIAKRRQEIEG